MTPAQTLSISKANALSKRIDEAQRASGKYLPPSHRLIKRFDKIVKTLKDQGLTISDHVVIWE